MDREILPRFMRVLESAVFGHSHAYRFGEVSTANESFTEMAIENCTHGGGDEPLDRRFLLGLALFLFGVEGLDSAGGEWRILERSVCCRMR